MKWAKKREGQLFFLGFPPFRTAILMHTKLPSIRFGRVRLLVTAENEYYN